MKVKKISSNPIDIKAAPSLGRVHSSNYENSTPSTAVGSTPSDNTPVSHGIWRYGNGILSARSDNLPTENSLGMKARPLFDQN